MMDTTRPCGQTDLGAREGKAPKGPQMAAGPPRTRRFGEVLEAGGPKPDGQPGEMAGALLAGKGLPFVHGGLRERAQPGAEVRGAAAEPCIRPTELDAMLAERARDVRLARDGEGRFLLRFAVKDGALAGTRVAVSSDAGVVSATLVPTEPGLAPDLEQALEAARLGLELRGIAVGSMEVVADDRRGSDRDRWARADEETGPPRRPAGAVECPCPGSATAIDYFV